MEFIKHDYLIESEYMETQTENTYFDGVPYHEEMVHHQEGFHPGYLPVFYDYRQLERHLDGGEGPCEWSEWNERQVMVKVETDLEAAAASYSEEGKKIIYVLYLVGRKVNTDLNMKIPLSS